MIEKIVLDYLAEELKPIPVYMNVPESNPNPGGGMFVVLEKTGSSLLNWIGEATFAIQSYAPTLYEAATLNEAVKTAMLEITTLDEITSVMLNGDYNFTDETKKQPRYQAVFEISHYL